MAEKQIQQKLFLQDLWLLPAISILTIGFMISVSEIGARAIWPGSGEDPCSNFNGVPGRFRPNCKAMIKPPEGPWVENSYNDCGYRTNQSCTAKNAGSLRVAVLGASFAYGFAVPYADVYSTLEGKALERRCRKPVEFQNVTSPGVDLLAIYRRTDEALALKPDLLILAIAPFDVRVHISEQQLAHRNDVAELTPKEKIPVRRDPWLKRAFIAPLKESRAVYMLEHFMYQDPDTYLRLYLLYGDRADFVRNSFSSDWQKQFAAFETLLGDTVDKAHAASVPMLILIGPTVAAVAVENTTPNPLLNANAFAEKISSIASKYQVRVVDPLPLFKGISHPMSYFYTVDGHMNAAGQPLVAQALDKEIISGKYPAFSECQER